MAKVFKRYKIDDEPIPKNQTVLLWSIRHWGPALGVKIPSGKVIIGLDTFDEIADPTHWAPLDPLHIDVDIFKMPDLK